MKNKWRERKSEKRKNEQTNNIGWCRGIERKRNRQ